MVFTKCPECLKRFVKHGNRIYCSEYCKRLYKDKDKKIKRE